MSDCQGKFSYASQSKQWHVMNRITDDSYNQIAIKAIVDVYVDTHLSQDQRDSLLAALKALGATATDYIKLCRRLADG
tara:strand:- start:1008 stop:1241 length:234 start_codon:yes stop_codon:yes gene_type:complete